VTKANFIKIWAELILVWLAE